MIRTLHGLIMYCHVTAFKLGLSGTWVRISLLHSMDPKCHDLMQMHNNVSNIIADMYCHSLWLFAFDGHHVRYLHFHLDLSKWCSFLFFSFCFQILKPLIILILARVTATVQSWNIISMQWVYLHHGETINDITYEVSIRKEAALFAR